jgi:prepilin-type N-terminal cleavage/methylation domain-containing protein
MTMPRPAHGYTLLELMIGLTIAALVMLPLSEMLRAGADSARFVRAGLDQNADARFVLDRIVTQAARTDVPPPNAANAGNPAAWLAPRQYMLTNGALVETAPVGKTVRTSVLATGVRAFDLRMPDVGAGRLVLRIDLVFDRPDCDASRGQDCSIAYARTVRLGAAP